MKRESYNQSLWMDTWRHPLQMLGKLNICPFVYQKLCASYPHQSYGISSAKSFEEGGDITQMIVFASTMAN